MVCVPPNRCVPDLVFFITTGLKNRSRLFGQSAPARLVLECFQFFRANGEIELYGFVIMPDHLHVILKTKPPLTISRFVKRMKTHISHLLGHGPIWEKGYWSEVIESEAFMKQKLVYIHENPVRAGLARKPEDYPWSSAREYLCKSTSDIIDPY